MQRRFLPITLLLVSLLGGCASKPAAAPVSSSRREFNPATQRYEASGPYGSRENRDGSGGSVR